LTELGHKELSFNFKHSLSRLITTLFKMIWEMSPLGRMTHPGVLPHSPFCRDSLITQPFSMVVVETGARKGCLGRCVVGFPDKG
jgi:hypothetical protein